MKPDLPRSDSNPQVSVQAEVCANRCCSITSKSNSLGPGRAEVGEEGVA